MAADTEKTPLINDESDDTEQYPRPRHRVKATFTSNKDVVLSGIANGGNLRVENHGSSGNMSTSSSMSLASQSVLQIEPDHIVSVFVVAFDTKAGNVVEWCMPEDFELSGVEFKAMASGFHTLLNDFVYFRMDNLYGLACFENMKVESEIERGARMKSVGILSTSYTLLYRHMQFLETQVRHQLETPCQYRQLQAFWEDKKGTLPMSESASSLKIYSPGSTPLSELMPEMKITHPAGCFSQFIKFFGEQIFVLWKFALLGKRILFFSPPPIGVVCYRVYCACCLTLHDLQQQFPERTTQPHFYVNVADIDTLESEVSYIACTTEKIFESKKQLHDVYVDNQVVRTSSEHLKDLLKANSADRAKLQLLNSQRRSEFGSMMNGYDNDDIDEEETVTMFFTEQNNRLFQTLLDVSYSSDRTLTADHMKDMGLDPTADRTFVMELLEAYGIDVMLVVDNPCCPR